MMPIPMLLPALLAAAAPAQTQADMTAQASRAFARADAAMNAQYRTTMAAMKRIDADGPAPDNRPGFAATLLASQRAWLPYRDATCVVEGYGYRGGSAEPAERSACAARLTRDRTAWLKAQTR